MRTVLTGGDVLDVRSGTVARADVVVEDGLIAELGSGLDADDADDVSGLTLLPGLIDCHTHVMFTRFDYLELLQRPFSLQFYEAAANLRATLEGGITTARDAWGADLGVKQAVERGFVPGPRLHIAVSMLSQTGGHGDPWFPCGATLDFAPVHPGRPSGLADGADELRKRVRELARAGADVIKIATSGGVLSPNDDPRHPQFTPEELAVVVQEAAARGLDVMAHAQSTEGIKNAVRAGVRSIEHGVFLDDEAVELMVASGTFLVPTLIAIHGVIEIGRRGGAISAASLRKAEEVAHVHAAAIKLAVEAGVRVAMGTDSSLTPHGENLRELHVMAQAGMPPVDVLRSATLHAARLLRVDHELGEIRPGARADLVAMRGDPFDLEDYHDRVVGVWKDGQRYAGRASSRASSGVLG